MDGFFRVSRDRVGEIELAEEHDRNPNVNVGGGRVYILQA